MEFDSLHSYLEYCFSQEGNVTDTMIKKAKHEYRKLYHSYYYGKYTKRHKQINFRVSQKQYLEFEKLAKNQNIKVSTYIKQVVQKNINSNSHFDLKTTLLLLLQAIDIIEEAINEQESMEAKELLLLLKQIQKELK